MSSDSHGHLQECMGIWGRRPCINQIFTIRVAYTESLPVPPGTHEAYRFPQSLACYDCISARYLEAGLAACERCLVGEERECNTVYYGFKENIRAGQKRYSVFTSDVLYLACLLCQV